MKKPIVVGFDFDGVIAYNPARLIRHPVSWVKKTVFGIEKVQFFVPKNPAERLFWSLAHETSMFPARGCGQLKELVRSGVIEAHLLTSRFGFLEPNLKRFLWMWGLDGVFTSMTLNYKEEQPHEFKLRMIRQKRFSYFVEDNWDIVSYLSSKRLPTTIHWIYNLMDRRTVYRYKFPFLARSLEAIVSS